MKNIIVAIDIDKESQNIIDFALEFAFSTKASLTFLHTIMPNLPDSSSSADEVLNEHSETLREIVEKVAIKSAFDQEIINYKIDHGFFVEKIIENCQSIHADLLILGISSNENKTGNVFSGGAKEILRGSSIPVIFIPERYKLTNIDKLLYSIDFSFEEINPLLDFVKLGKKLDALITSLHVWQKDDPIEIVKHNLQTYRRLFKYRSTENKVSFELRSGDPVEEILDFISTHKIDIFCMKVHDYKPLSRLFKPSISGRLAKRIKIPLMVIQNAPSLINISEENTTSDNKVLI